MVLLAKKTVLLAKIETDPGTAETLDAGDGVFNIYDAKVASDIEFIPRKGQAAMSAIKGVTGARKGTITFRTDLVGSGTSGAPTPAWASTLLPACGMVAGTGNTFLPYSEAPGANVKTVSIAHLADGKQWLLRGCMGKADFTLPAGKTGDVGFTFTGILDEPTDEGLVVPAFPTTMPPRFAVNAVSLNGTATAQVVSEIKLTLDNTVALREDSADAGASGYGYAIISERAVKGTMAPEAYPQGTYNADAIFLAGGTQALSFSIGSIAGNIITFSMPAVQFTKVNLGERNGVQTNDLEFQAVRSADAGDDELTITFS